MFLMSFIPKLLVYITLALSALTLSTSVGATSCATFSLGEYFDMSDVVIEGQVKKNVKSKENEYSGFLDVKVFQTYKGNLVEHKQAKLHYSYPFGGLVASAVEGRTILVFANYLEGNLTTPECGGTHLIGPRTAEFFERESFRQLRAELLTLKNQNLHIETTDTEVLVLQCEKLCPK